MKFILPIFILLFVSGCTLPKANQPTYSESQKKSKVKTPVKKTKSKEKVVFKYVKKHMLNNDSDEQVYTSLNKTIIGIADQLFKSNISKKNPLRIILTSFVDLNNLNKTTPFGRVISESMFNELHVRKFKITDFRGQETVSVNEDGEFHITREVEKLKDSIESVEFILVGTYAKFEDQSLVVNARIVDSISGNVVSSARVVYQPHDCKVFDLCSKPALIEPEEVMQEKKMPKKVVKKEPVEDKTPIMIIEDK
jgi:TolB-like protein